MIDSVQTANDRAVAQLQSATSNSITSDFDTFLQLLTAQIRNQDPLEPSDSTEFVAQLATFSAVEQQIQTNNLLENLVTATHSQNLGDLARLVGMEAEVDGPAYFGGDPIKLNPTVPVSADRAEMVVEAPDGTEAARLSLLLDGKPFEWDGRDNNGLLVNDSIYTFHVEAYAGDAALDTGKITTYQKVKEVSLAGNAPALIFAGDVELSIDKVLSLRDG